MPIIEVNNLTKEYSLGAVTGIKDTIRHGLSRLIRKKTWGREKFKSLDDVSFSVEKGEVLGIIGHNGAGKSTLLKHLAHITNPTHGEVSIHGSVAPLIEVGAGVNPELTGRENIYLNGAILGIPKVIINRKLEEIIEFSELRQFIDTPVKRYSSGMTVKLGFSIATSMDADILIVDEVLAVGDLAFQRKCFDRMEEMIKRQGRTVLLVSHNIRQVERICTRVLLLDHGKIVADGIPSNICRLFYEKSDQKIQENTRKAQGRFESSGELVLLKTTLVDHNGQEVNTIKYGCEIEVRLTYKANNRLTNPVFGLGVHTTDFLYLTTHYSDSKTASQCINPGEFTVICRINHFPLLPGAYALRAGVSAGQLHTTVFYAENILTFRVASENPEFAESERQGFIPLDASWNLPDQDTD